MKKFYIFTLVAAMFAACTSNMTDEQAVCIDIATPETLIGTFEGDEMRIQLDNGKTVWTADDLVSVFYLSNANQKWQYQGETGERTGNLKQVEAGSATETMKRVVVVYPYNENYYINTDTYNVKGWLPAEQTYLADSYGLNGNIMISQSEYNQFSLKNVCGWLKLQLTGNGEKVQSITLKGNNGEQVAGEVYINSADATASLAADMGSAGDNDNSAGGNLVFEDTILTEVTLNCGDGVTLSAEPTAFYIALPPQTFGKGLTVEVSCSDGSTMTKSTEKEVIIARNTIQPMAAIAYQGEFPDSWKIYYIAGQKVEPYNKNAFGANIISNTYDADKKCWVLSFDNVVTKIGYYAFRGCSNLQGIIIPSQVVTIEEYAFGLCDNLKHVTIPDSVVDIEKLAFYSCQNIEAFYGKFASVDNRCLIIDGVLKMYATNCSALDFSVPNNVSTIEDFAFYGSTNLTNLTISDSVETIEKGAFYGCKNLENITFGSNLTTLKGSAFCSCSKLTSLIIPDSVTLVGDHAFESCSSLTEVTIGKSVKSIERNAFASCSNLEKVYCQLISPPALGVSAFYNNASNLRIYVPYTSIDDYIHIWGVDYKDILVAYDFDKNEIVQQNNEIWYTATRKIEPYKTRAFSTNASYGTEYVSNEWNSETGKGVMKFNGNLTSIADEAFCDCRNLISITLPNSITWVGNKVFYGCTSLTHFYGKHASSDNRCLIINGSLKAVAPAGIAELTEYTIPDGVTSIGDSTFSTCTSLTSVTIPDSVTSIGKYAFEYCRKLTSITIPEKVSSIGRNAFGNCDALSKVNITNLSAWCKIVFDCIEKQSNSVSFYLATNPLYYADLYIDGSKITDLIIPTDITEIKNSTFMGCSSLTNVQLHDGITSIGYYAFGNCTSLTSITIPKSVVKMAEYCFEDCNNLKTINCKATVPPSILYNNANWIHLFDSYVERINVPSESVSSYKSAVGWKDYKNKIWGYNF